MHQDQSRASRGAISKDTMSDDILKVIPIEDLHHLRFMYKTHLPYTYYVCCLLDVCIQWMGKDPSRNDFIFLAPDGDWKTSGTFVLIMQFGTYDLYVFTLEKSCGALRKALVETNVIDWMKEITVFAIHKEHTPTTLQVLLDKGLPTVLIENYIWRIPIEKALLFDVQCPNDVYIKKLNVSDAVLVNDVWPHRHEGTETYIATLIEMNVGYGVFLKNNGTLAAWILRTQLGCLGNLQTLEQHRRKGYGALITKVLAKKIAEEGHDPWATIVVGNERSENLFRSLGFQIMDKCTYIEIF